MNSMRKLAAFLVLNQVNTLRRKLIILTAATLLVGCDSVCENEVIESVRSPSGRMQAVAFNRGCGATVGFKMRDRR